MVLALVDIHETGEPSRGRDRTALRRRLIDESEKEPTEEFGAFVFEQSLLGVDEDHFPRRIDFGEQIDFGARARKHPAERRVAEYRKQPRVDLLARLLEGGIVVEVGGEESARAEAAGVHDYRRGEEGAGEGSREGG